MYLGQAASGGEDPNCVAPGGGPGVPEADSPLTPPRLQATASGSDFGLFSQ